MASNIRVNKVCKFCGKEFIARMTTTRFCTQVCASKAYYERVRAERINKKNKKVSIEEINQKQILTVPETARLLKCSNKTIYRLIEKGNLKAGNLSDRMTRIKRSEIDSILDAQKDDELDNVDLSKYYTMEQIRNLFTISDKAIYELVKRQNIQKIKIGKLIYIPKQPIDNIL